MPWIEKKERNAEIAKLYRDGVLVREIAARYGIREQSLRRVLRRAFERGEIAYRWTRAKHRRGSS